MGCQLECWCCHSTQDYTDFWGHGTQTENNRARREFLVMANALALHFLDGRRRENSILNVKRERERGSDFDVMYRFPYIQQPHFNSLWFLRLLSKELSGPFVKLLKGIRIVAFTSIVVQYIYMERDEPICGS